MANLQTYHLPRQELQVDIYYLKNRKTPVPSSCQFHYDGKDFDVTLQSVGKPSYQGVETGSALLQTANPEFHVGQFYVGKEFEIREGLKTFGKGRITKILRPDFNYWDTKTFLKTLAPNVKPYAGENMQGYRIDFDYYLSDTELLTDIDFEQTGNKECMLIVKCHLVKKDIQPRLVANTVIDTWKENLATSNQLYKVELQTKPDIHSNKLLLEKFTLTFASWHSIYLTGQIIVTQ
jgi:hypothetical protein